MPTDAPSRPSVAAPPRSAAAAATAPRAHASADVGARTWRAVLGDYWTLTKPEISFLVTVSAFAGFLLGSPEELAWVPLVATLAGVALCAGGAGILNHVAEVDLDARMKRTADRPLPAGRLDAAQAKRVGVGLVAAGVGLICPLVNPLTALLAALTAALYVWVYTPLKRVTKWNTLVGTLPGALPALGGYTAATGALGAGGWALFGILACWQMPHFLSLAWMYRKDYARGDYAMLPVVEPSGDSTAAQMIGFTVLLLGVSTLPTVVGAAGWLYLLGVVPLGAWFLRSTFAFHAQRTGAAARRVLKASIVYIPALVALIGVDWIVGW